MQYIYLLSDPRNNAPRYVGITNNPKNRLWHHLREKKNNHRCHWLQQLKALDLIPLIEILETVEDEDRDISEVAWILGFRIAGYNLVNGTMGGEGGLGNKNWLGKRHTAETKRKMSISGLGNKRWLGRKHTPETKEKMRLAQIGRLVTLESRKNMSLAQKERYRRKREVK